jgi:hypothetical protein
MYMRPIDTGYGMLQQQQYHPCVHTPVGQSIIRIPQAGFSSRLPSVWNLATSVGGQPGCVTSPGCMSPGTVYPHGISLTVIHDVKSAGIITRAECAHMLLPGQSPHLRALAGVPSAAVASSTEMNPGWPPRWLMSHPVNPLGTSLPQ